MTYASDTTRLTLAELAKRHVGDKSEAAIIAEILNKQNPILQDAPWRESNETFSHVVVRRGSLPTGTKRRINAGVPNEVSRTGKVREGMMMLESYSEADEAIIDNDPNPNEARMGEATAFLEGMSQTHADSVFYGNSGTDPEDIDGLATRMASLDTDGNVLDGGGSSNCTSVYVVMWGLETVFKVYPRGSKTMGVTRVDKGKVTLFDASGYKFEGYRDHFKLHCGLVVKDSRAIGRIANIEATGDNVFDEDDLITLINRMPEGKKYIYVNATVLTQMQIAMKDKANVNFLPGKGEGLFGEPVMMFTGGHPIKKCESILQTESAIS